MKRLVSATAVALLLALPAYGQDKAQSSSQGQMQDQKPQGQSQSQKQSQNQAQNQGQNQIKTLAAWKYDDLYDSGWRAESLLDANVYGPGGEEIGEVENILIGPDNRIVSLIVEIGGFLNVGVTTANIPWDQVQMAPDASRVTIPITEDKIQAYSLFSQGVLSLPEARSVAQTAEGPATGPRLWKISSLIDDYAVLPGNRGYGYVEDVVFDQKGAVKAVLVNRDIALGGGPYAFPFVRDGWDPFDDYYGLPYSDNELAELEPFDYGRLD